MDSNLNWISEYLKNEKYKIDPVYLSYILSLKKQDHEGQIMIAL